MARIRISESAETDGRSSLYRDPSMPPLPSYRDNSEAASSVTFSPGVSSDKENQENPSRSKAPSRVTSLSTASSDHHATSHSYKRRRLTERGESPASPSARRQTLDERDDIQYYDPDQDPDERRAIRKGLRDLTKELNESRSEYLQPQSNGLHDSIRKADTLFTSVKQTSDATVDSRFLVTAGDLAVKRTTQLQFGDGTQGIDVDEFVSKCISFMRRGDEVDKVAGNALRLRRDRAGVNDDDDNALDDGGNRPLNWEWLGTTACIPNNRRPPAPGFLLGPLSVQKRARAARTRRAPLARSAVDVVRPEELQAEDLDRAESSNLRTLCRQLHQRLLSITAEGTTIAEEAYNAGNESRALLIAEKYGISSDGGLNLFKFVINPWDFGQTVENLFYVSFLIRDDMIGINTDDDGLPTLHNTEGQDPKDAAQLKSAKKHQAVFSLDFHTWRELVRVFDIKEPLIPHRETHGSSNEIGSRGWYA